MATSPNPAKKQSEENEEEIQLKALVLKLYSDQIAEIDEVRMKQPKSKRLSRHRWMVSAILEKLEKEKKQLKKI